jgi:hypothetical protein
MLISAACKWPATLNSYKTAIPFAAFIATISIDWVIFGGIVLTGVTFLFGLGWFFSSRTGNAEKVPGLMNRSRNYYRDALVFAVAGGAAWVGFQNLAAVLSQKLAGASAEATTFPSFDSLVPAAQSIASALLFALFACAVVSAVGGFVTAYVPSRAIRGLLLIGAGLAGMGSGESGLAFVIALLLTILKIFIIWWVIVKIIRHNLLGFFLLAAALSLLNDGTSLVAQPNTYLRNNGVIVLGVLALLLLWPLAAWLRRPGDATSVPVSS